jgi:tetratricopeptide (TPR) repeat protein
MRMRQRRGGDAARGRAATITTLAVGLALAAGCASSPAPGRDAGDDGRADDPEATALTGEPLFPSKLAADVRAEREEQLREARARYEADPRSEERIVWLGRRTAYLGRYREAIAIYSEGLRLHPRSYRLWRHRGHRFITTRRLDDAISDLSEAARLIQGVPDAVEPDGLPNRLGIPTSTTHTNIYYHLGLARYLRGEFEAARVAYRRCSDFADNDDMRCAAWYWLYLTLRRLGEHEQAAELLEPVGPGMSIIENTSYHRLLLLFKGELGPEVVAGEGDAIDDATVAYGVAMWWWLQGDRARAFEMFRGITAGSAWAAFGHIAAEAERARAAAAQPEARGTSAGAAAARGSSS